MQPALNIPQAFSTVINHFTAEKLPEAENLCRQIVQADPRNAQALHLLGMIYNKMGKYHDAAPMLQKAVSIKKDVPVYFLNLGIALHGTGNIEGALRAYRDALKLDPANAEIHCAIATLLQESGDMNGAAAAYQEALKYNPQFAEAYTHLGTICMRSGQMDDAIALHQSAIALKPDLAIAHNNLGITLAELKRFDEALVHCSNALALCRTETEKAPFYFNIALMMKHQKNMPVCLQAYEKAYQGMPQSPAFLSEYLHQLYYACAWDQMGDLNHKLLQMVREGHPVAPFILLPIPGSTAEDHLRAARQYSRQYTVPKTQQFTHQPRQREKIRIGYLSYDFFQHATAILMAEVFERHDRERFETFAYSYSPDDKSPMRQRLEKAFDHFVEIGPLSHAAAAKKIHEDGIDILIDLKGLSGSARPQILAYRPAPMQVQYLGYPGTMGADFIDHIIADPFILPHNQQKYYSEKIHHLPDCYQPNDRARAIADTVYTRAACGLPETGFVFCSFNGAYKITPEIFAIWMRLLKAVPGSVLWQLESNELVKENLHRAAAAHGVDPSRIIFAPLMAPAAYLARMKLADLFLDTLPVNAHTTASDSLWAGVPVLTCAGNTFAGRVAGSILMAAGLPELVTASLADYETKALHLAQHPAELSALRDRLERTKLQTPLFDSEKFTRNLENLYADIWHGYAKA